MKSVFQLFRIRRDERWPALAVLVYVVVLNAMVVNHYADRFFDLVRNYHRFFIHEFHISGFDPLSYAVLSQWDTEYNIFRHPLLAFFMYLPNQINQGLIMLTGCNFAPVVMAFLLVFCAFYSFIFLCRIFRDVIGLPRTDARLLGMLTFSFAYVMVSVSVPDHFSLSMFALILTLYIAGLKMTAGRQLSIWQTIMLFVFTAGISLNNGVKVFLSALFVNGKRFWRPAFLFFAVFVPSLLMWFGTRVEWNYYEKPKFVARQLKREKIADKRHEKLAQAFKDTTTLRDSIAINAAIQAQIAADDSAREAHRTKAAGQKEPARHIAQGEFMQWTDISTPRWPSMVENVFGEPLQLHQDNLLEDVRTKRPEIVHYRCVMNYVVEGLLVFLFVAGIWFGRRNRFLWLALLFMAFDLFIHEGLGFGIEEVYIMSPHWLFVLTIAMAFVFKAAENSRWLRPLRLLTLALALWLLGWNSWLYGTYLL